MDLGIEDFGDYMALIRERIVCPCFIKLHLSDLPLTATLAIGRWRCFAITLLAAYCTYAAVWSSAPSVVPIHISRGKLSPPALSRSVPTLSNSLPSILCQQAICLALFW